MKIAIVSELKINTPNYGNVLQAFALNKILNNYHNCEAVSLYSDGTKAAEDSSLIVTKKISTLSIAKKKFVDLLHPKRRVIKTEADNVSKNSAFIDFIKQNIHIDQEKIAWQRLLDSDYDAFIVGSDVVWSQSPGKVNRIKFLDFNNKKNAIKFSYAASFGGNMIPKENVAELQRCLSDFLAVSVRENSAVSLLESIGVKNVQHVVDPTLLIDKKTWEAYEEKPEEIDGGFIFCYLLNISDRNKKRIQDFSNQIGLPIVCLFGQSGAETFGDVTIEVGTIGEWLWLIHHAQFILTDSFHGIVFSTIFENRFMYVEREETNKLRKLNLRMLEYLKLIHQSDKVFDLMDISNINDFVWKYEEINAQINALKKRSMEYLDMIVDSVERRQ